MFGIERVRGSRSEKSPTAWTHESCQMNTAVCCHVHCLSKLCRILDLAGDRSLLQLSRVAVIDRAPYASEKFTPKLALRQMFGKEALGRSAADKRLLTVVMFAMLSQEPRTCRQYGAGSHSAKALQNQYASELEWRKSSVRPATSRGRTTRG